MGLGCNRCKYFCQETYHQTGFGTRYSYRCCKPYERTVEYFSLHKTVTETVLSRGLDEPKVECDEAEEGKGERWIQFIG